jgi:hypothetical protein
MRAFSKFVVESENGIREKLTDWAHERVAFGSFFSSKHLNLQNPNNVAD